MLLWVGGVSFWVGGARPPFWEVVNPKSSLSWVGGTPLVSSSRNWSRKLSESKSAEPGIISTSSELVKLVLVPVKQVWPLSCCRRRSASASGRIVSKDSAKWVSSDMSQVVEEVGVANTEWSISRGSGSIDFKVSRDGGCKKERYSESSDEVWVGVTGVGGSWVSGTWVGGTWVGGAGTWGMNWLDDCILCVGRTVVGVAWQSKGRTIARTDDKVGVAGVLCPLL